MENAETKTARPETITFDQEAELVAAAVAAAIDLVGMIVRAGGEASK